MPRTEWSIDGTKLYELTDQWITENIGEEEAKHANYGWFVDYIEGTICTKVYGENGGVVVIDTHGCISFEPWG